MAFDINNPYFRHKVMTASPQELRMLLLDGAIHFVDIGREGLANQDWEKVYEGFSQSKAIVMELITSLNHEVDPDLCARVQSLYTYIYSLLIDASFKRDDAKAKEARERLEYERETWGMLMQQLHKDGGDGATRAPGAQGVPQEGVPAGVSSDVQAAPPQRRSFSVQG
ncbi:MAG: hypothetical protein Tsb0013_23580 [Phycisphaerales bacterium]